VKLSYLVVNGAKENLIAMTKYVSGYCNNKILYNCNQHEEDNTTLHINVGNSKFI